MLGTLLPGLGQLVRRPAPIPADKASPTTRTDSSQVSTPRLHAFARSFGNLADQMLVRQRGSSKEDEASIHLQPEVASAFDRAHLDGASLNVSARTTTTSSGVLVSGAGGHVRLGSTSLSGSGIGAATASR